MGAKHSEIDTAAKRAKLPVRRNPYWQGISGGRGGVSLGYRKAALGPGNWVAKLVSGGARIEERLAAADDAKAVSGALTYPAAVTEAFAWARRQAAAIDARSVVGTERGAPTVRTAVAWYIADRQARSPRRGADARSRLGRHVLADPAFADLDLSKITSSKIEQWRGRLAASLQPATINRLLNDLRAALNAAVEKHRRELPAHVVGDVKVGTRAIRAANEARRQILTDDEVRRLIEAAFTVDESGDFGRLVMLAAATGARFSQLAACTVADFQIERLRIMLPVSHKGRGEKSAARIAVPVAADVVDRLRPALLGRAAAAPLLERWHVRQVGPFSWERTHRASWKSASATDRAWKKTLVLAEVDAATVMYALRHSSIVRGLRSGLPVRLVSALHDTSTAMVEKHYAAFIVDATEELARRAVMSMHRPLPIAAE